NTICTGSSFTITPTNETDGSVPAGTLYKWDAPSYSNASLSGGMSRSTSTTNIFGGPIVNPTTQVQTVIYRVMPEWVGNCSGSSFTVVISVDPKPVITEMSTVICSGIQFDLNPSNIINGVVPANTRYAWAMPSGTDIGNGQTGNNQPTINGTLTNAANVQRTATYLVTPTFGTCTGAQFTVTIFINPGPSLNTIFKSVCTGTSFVITPTNGIDGFIPSGTSFKWDAPIYSNASITGGSSRTNSTSSIFDGPLYNPTNNIYTASYRVSPDWVGDCKGNSFTLVVTVDPMPMVNAMSTVICSGFQFIVNPQDKVNGNVPSAIKYAWGLPTASNAAGGVVADNQPTINGTLITNVTTARTATYLVTPSVGTCTGSQFTTTVLVKPAPYINTITRYFCIGSTFSLSPTDGVDGIVLPGSLYRWDAVSGSGVSNSTPVASISGGPLSSSAVYRVVPSLGDCDGISFTLVVGIVSRPVVSSMSTVVCSGSQFVVTPPGGARYAWSAPTGADIGNGQSASDQPTINGTLTNSVNSQRTAIYIVTPNNIGCTGDTFTVTVTVLPAPSINTIIRTICTGSSFTVTPTNVTDGFIQPGTTYRWNSPIYTNPSMTGGQSYSNQSSNVFGGPLTNPTSGDIIANYQVIPHLGSCDGTSFTLVVWVNPMPMVSAMSTVVCSGSSFLVAPVNGINGIVMPSIYMRYAWGLPTGANIGNGQTGVDQQTINGMLTIDSNQQRTATYSVTPSYGSCTGSPFTVTVFINPAPIINAININLCTGNSFVYTPTTGIDGYVPAGSTFTWGLPSYSNASVSGGGVSNSTPSASIFGGPLFNPTSYRNTVTYPVIARYGNCDGPAFNLTAYVDAKPVISAMSMVICSGSQFVLNPTNGVNGFVPVDTRYTWNSPTGADIGNGQPGDGQTSINGTLTNSVNTQRSATYLVTPSNLACAGLTQTGNAFTVTIFVDPAPIINTIYQTICTGTSFAITPTNGVDGFVPPGTTYRWGTPTYSSASLTGGSSRTTPSSNIFGATLTNPTDVLQTASYQAIPRVSNCDGPAFNVTIRVNPRPVISAMSTSVCSGAQFNVVPINGINGIVPPVPLDTKFSWGLPTGANIGGGQTGDTQNSINGTLTNGVNATRTATYIVTPATEGCLGNQFTVTVFINPGPVINTINRTICSGTSFSVTPTDVIDGFVPNGTLFSWNAPVFSSPSLTGGSSRSTPSSNIFDGSIINPTSSQQTAAYRVTAQAVNCVGSTFTLIITLDPKPVIQAMSTVVCSGAPFAIVPVDVTNGVVPENTRYAWSAPSGVNIGNGQSSADQTSVNGTLTNSFSGLRTATYLVTPSNGTCSGLTQSGGQFTVTVFVNAGPSINTINRTICTGTTFEVTPTSGTDGYVPAGTTYRWSSPVYSHASMSGGSSRNTPATSIFGGPLLNPTKDFQTASYLVTPIGSNCEGVPFQVVIRVDPKPSASAMSVVTCSGVPFSVNPSDIASNLVTGDTRYAWNSPTGANIGGGQPGNDQPTISGSLTNGTTQMVTATYIVTPSFGACSGLTQSGSPFTVTVSIKAAPTLNIINQTICSGTSFAITPTDVTDGYVPAGTTYVWSAPTYSNASISGGASRTIASSNLFGGPIFNPTSVKYTATYNVTPKYDNCDGGPFLLIVSIEPLPVINAMSTVVCSGSQFLVTPANIVNGNVPINTKYAWNTPTGLNIGNGQAGALQSNINGTLTIGVNAQRTATYSITPSNSGCLGNPFTFTAFVNPTPLINTIYTSICSGSPVSITPVNGLHGIVPASTNYTWSTPTYASASMSGGTSRSTPLSQIFDALITNPANYSFTATYVVTPNATGCVGTNFILVVYVDPKPVIAAMSGVVCSGESFSLYPSNGGGNLVPDNLNLSWSAPTGTDITNGSSYSGSDNIWGNLSNSVNAMRTATYLVTPYSGSCVGGFSGNPFTVTVHVNPKPSIANINTTICSGTTFVLTPTASGSNIIPNATKYSWGVPVPEIASLTGGQASAFSSNNIFGTITNPTSSKYSVRYTVIPSSNSCIGSSFFVDAFIDPKPSINAMSTVICSGSQFVVSPSDVMNGIVPAGTRYSWSAPTGLNVGNGQPATDQTSINGMLTNGVNSQRTATYLVTPSFGTCSGLTQSGNQFTLTVFINPAPSINTINRTICTGTTFSITPTDVTDGFVPAGSTFTWEAPVYSSPSLTGGSSNSIASSNLYGTAINNPTSIQQTASFRVTPRSGSCDGASFWLVITIDPKPSITAMSSVVCSGLQFVVSPTDVVNGSVPSNTRYSWNSPSGSNLFNGQAASNQPTIFGTLTNGVSDQRTATYVVTPSFGTCTGLTLSGNPFTVTVFINPAPAINTLYRTICTGTTFMATPTN
ncbi:MAG: hypothetical protein EBX50_12515, partial [Chitinophagia bacterium]|nr:hypothetical protein [Chitinophagia bacterium]